MTLKEVIKKHTKELLLSGGLICCQNLTGVGALQGTWPTELDDHPGVVELPTSDVSNSGIAVGMALTGRRVMYVIRFAGFVWLNASNLVNYAAKCKEMWDVPCPVFTRLISGEGALGPVASHTFNGMLMGMPGVKLFYPVTSGEWVQAWDCFMSSTEPVICCESRMTYPLDREMANVIKSENQGVIFAIGYARLAAEQAAERLGFNLIHVHRLKPFETDHLEELSRHRVGFVVDTDFTMGGAGQIIAAELMKRTGVPVHSLGLEDRTAGFSKDNLSPDANRIIRFITNEKPREDGT